MPPEENKSKVDQLSDKLNSRTRYQAPSDARSVVRDSDSSTVEESWQTTPLNEMLTHEREAKPINPAMKKVFIFAVLFFIATLLVAAFVFLGGSNFISSKNLDINLVGPTTASAGQVVELGVTVENRNNTDLELANLSVSYPENTRDADDQTKPLTFSKYSMGVVKAGGESARNIRLVLLGASGEVKELKFSVEYKVKGSNANFYKDKVYDITIGETPVSVNISSPPKVSSGGSFTIRASVKLNSTEALRNVMFKAEYPYGYSFDSASPATFADNNIWSLGDLPPGSQKTVAITGHLQGENLDERTFRFYVGAGQGSAPSTNFTPIISTQETVSIEKPSISLGISFNGEQALTYIAPPSQNITTSINFQNNLPETVINPTLEVRVSGGALNSTSVVPQNSGAYNASAHKIVWNIANTQGQSQLAPGERNSVAFSFASQPETLISGSHDIALQFIFTGTSLTTNAPVTVSETRTVHVGSQVSLTTQALHSTGPFANTGPIPPKVGQETTYGIIWSIGNTYTTLSGAKVTAKLGNNVKWLGAQAAAGENISFDQTSNTVTWNLGDVSSGLGFSGPARMVAFKVSLTPSSVQIGSVPILVSNTTFSALDSSSGRNSVIYSSALTTTLPSDPAFIQGDDIVVK